MDKRALKSNLKPMNPQPTLLTVEGRLRLPIKCLLCDIYGTLLISGSGDIGTGRGQVLEEQSLRRLLADFNIKQPPETLRNDLYSAIEQAHHRARAEGIDHPEVKIEEIWARILPFSGKEKIEDFSVRWEMAVNPVWPMPGLKELITACRLGGIALGIISNAQFFTPLLFQWLLDADLERLGFDRRLIHFSYQHGRAKPSPFLFRSAASELKAMGIARGETAFIGNDMRNDILPALQTGFQTILFAGDRRSLRLRQDDPYCRDLHPDLQINHLSQLSSFLFDGGFNPGFESD